MQKDPPLVFRSEDGKKIFRFIGHASEHDSEVLYSTDGGTTFQSLTVISVRSLHSGKDKSEEDIWFKWPSGELSKKKIHRVNDVVEFDNEQYHLQSEKWVDTSSINGVSKGDKTSSTKKRKKQS